MEENMKKISKISVAILLIAAIVMSLGISSAAEVTGVTTVYSNDYSTKTSKEKTVGTYKDNYTFALKEGADGGKFLDFSPKAEFTSAAGDYLEYSLGGSLKSTGADTDANYLVLDFDICTEGLYYPTLRIQLAARKNSGTGTGLASGNNVYIAHDSETGKTYFQDTSENNVVEIDNAHGAWTHMTIVFDVELITDANPSASTNTVAHYYINGQHVYSTKAWKSNGRIPDTFSTLRLIPDAKVTLNSDYSLCVDNFTYTMYSLASNTNLGEVIADTTKTLDEFDDSIYTSDYVFPKATAIASIGDTKFGSYKEIYEATKTGDTLELLTDFNDTFVPTRTMTVNTNGYAFNYDATGFDVTTDGDTVSFTLLFNATTVKWHIGDTVVEEVYTEPVEAMYKGIYDEYITVGNLKYKALGFAKSEGGEVLDSLGVVSVDNCEFWLVYQAPIAMTASGSDASFAYAADEISSLITNAAAGSTVTFLADTEMTVDGTIAIPNAITLDLGGKTVTAKGVNTALFTLSADMTITGEGAIKAESGDLVTATKAVSLNVNNITATADKLIDSSSSDITVNAGVGTMLYVSEIKEGGEATVNTPDGYVLVLSGNKVLGYEVALESETATITWVNDTVSTPVVYKVGTVIDLEAIRVPVIRLENGINQAYIQETGWFDYDTYLTTELIVEVSEYYSYYTRVTSEKVKWAVFNADESAIISSSLDYDYDNVPSEAFNVLKTGYTLRFYTDLGYQDTNDKTYLQLPADAVVDLNGHTFTKKSDRFYNAVAEGTTCTVKNGTLDSGSQNVSYGLPNNKGSITFVNMNLIYTGESAMFDHRGGTINIEGGTVYSPNAVMDSLSARAATGKIISLNLKNVESIVCKGLVAIRMSSTDGTSAYTTFAHVSIEGCNVETTTLLTAGTGGSANNTIDLTIKDSYINASYDYLYAMQTDAAVTVNVESSHFSHNPKTGIPASTDSVTYYGIDNFVMATGQDIVENDEGLYLFSVKIPVTLSWNLSLYSDFDINFYLGIKGITSVTVNGVSYDLSTLEKDGNRYIITLGSIPASEVAQQIVFTVGYGDGMTFEKTLSIVDYAKEIIDGNYLAFEKELLATAIQYVAAAYVYANELDAECDDMPEALAELIVSESFLANLPENESIESTITTASLKDAIYSAQLKLAARLLFRFNLKSDFTGSITVEGMPYEVVNGVTTEGNSYIEIGVDSYLLYNDEIEISGTSASGVSFEGAYSLPAYVKKVQELHSNNNLDNLLVSLYSYSKSAEIAKTEIDTLNQLVFEKNGDGFAVVGYVGSASKINIPELYKGYAVNSIASSAFSGNTTLTSVTIPNSVTNIGNKAFMNCTALTSITLNDTLTNIGQYAFANTKLTEIVLPDSLVAVGQGALMGVNTLTKLTVPFIGGSHQTSNKYIGFIFGASGYVANESYVPATLKTIVLSDACKSIPAYSMVGCKGLETVVIGSGVQFIGISAFQNCENFNKIYIPATVTSIPANAYYYNSSFFGCSSELVIVLETTDTSSFGQYWNNLTSDTKAEVVTGKTFDEYQAEY